MVSQVESCSTSNPKSFVHNQRPASGDKYVIDAICVDSSMFTEIAPRFDLGPEDESDVTVFVGLHVSFLWRPLLNASVALSDISVKRRVNGLCSEDNDVRTDTDNKPAKSSFT